MSTLQKIILMMMALTYALLAGIKIVSTGNILPCYTHKHIHYERKIFSDICSESKAKALFFALSKDNKFLAVAEDAYVERYIVDSDKAGLIRIYDNKSEKLLKLLKSHEDIINDLAFSDDGKYLLSASADKSVKLWSTKDMSLVRTIDFHTKAVYHAKFGKNNTIISVGGKQIDIHSFEGKLLKSYTYSETLHGLTIEDDEIIVKHSDCDTLIFDMALNLKSKTYGACRSR